VLARCPRSSLQVHPAGIITLPTVLHPSTTSYKGVAWLAIHPNLESRSVSLSALWRCRCFPGCLARIWVLLTCLSTFQDLSGCIKDCLELMSIAQITSSSSAPRFKAVFKKFSHSSYSQVLLSVLSRIRRTLLPPCAHASCSSVKIPPAFSWLKTLFYTGHGFGSLPRDRYFGAASGLG
jgi:hypothetical protein